MSLENDQRPISSSLDNEGLNTLEKIEQIGKIWPGLVMHLTADALGQKVRQLFEPMVYQETVKSDDDTENK